MGEGRYTFDNGWWMEREADASGRQWFWVLRDGNNQIIDRDQYRADLFDRHKLRINGRTPYACPEQPA